LQRRCISVRRVGEERREEKADCGEDRSENFAAINLWSPKSSEQTDQQQSRADAEEQKIRRRQIAGDRKLGEKFVSEQAAKGDNESHPERPIPFPLYVDLAADIRKIHR